MERNEMWTRYCPACGSVMTACKLAITAPVERLYIPANPVASPRSAITRAS